jgi:hypothetical protein
MLLQCGNRNDYWRRLGKGFDFGPCHFKQLHGRISGSGMDLPYSMAQSRRKITPPAEQTSGAVSVAGNEPAHSLAAIQFDAPSQTGDNWYSKHPWPIEEQ